MLFLFPAELSAIICDNNVKAKTLLDRRKGFPVLETIILMEPIEEEMATKAKAEGVRLLEMHEVEVILLPSRIIHSFLSICFSLPKWLVLKFKCLFSFPDFGWVLIHFN